MSVKIRLQRGGRKALPVYSIVAADSRSGRDSRFIERLGHYAPKARGQEVPFAINAERLNHWVAQGAQVTDVVGRLLVKNSMGPESVREAFAAKRARRIRAQEAVKNAAAKREAAKAAKEGAAAAAAEAEAAAAAAKAEADAKAAAAAAEAAKAAEAAAAPADEQPAA